MSGVPDNLKADIDEVAVDRAESSLLIRIGQLAETATVEEIAELAYAFSKITHLDEDRLPEPANPEPAE